MASSSKAFSNHGNWFIILVGFAVLLPVVRAQTATAPACPPTTTLDQIPAAMDDAVSGPGNKDRACMKALMMPEARLIPVSVSPDGQVKTTVLSVADYTDRVAKHGDKAFYEHQIKYATDTYGNIAHLWSTYTITETPDGKPIMRGINSVQAVNDGTHWRILEITWQAETPVNPLPLQFLP